MLVEKNKGLLDAATLAVVSVAATAAAAAVAAAAAAAVAAAAAGELACGLRLARDAMALASTV